MYKDLREFIERVDKLRALRRITGADPRFEIGGITEVAAGRPDGPALLFDDIKGFPRGFRIFTNATTHPQRAALALGIDPQLRPLDALKAWMEKRKTLQPLAPALVKDAAFLQNTMQGDAVDLAKFPAPIWHRHDGGRVHRFGLDRDHARPRRRLDQRFDLSCSGARPEQGDRPVRPRRPARRHHRQEILGPGQALSAGGGQWRGPGAVHRRLRVPAHRTIGIRVRRRHQRRADRGLSRTADRPADPGARGDRARRSSPPHERDHVAGRAVRRIHRLLRIGSAAGAGHGGRRRPIIATIRSSWDRRR